MKFRFIFSSCIIPAIWKKKPLYISLPSIYFRNSQPYKKRGSLSGGVRSDIPWIRPHDSDAATDIKVLLSDFVKDINIVSDENIDDKIICENIVCIGSQSNFIFEQFVQKTNCIAPLEYKRSKGIDGFYNPSKNQSYESNDTTYAYGLFAVIKNPHAEDKRIVFVSGLDADTTRGITKTLKNNLKKIYKKIKHIKHRDSGFYYIFRFKRMADSTIPLKFDDLFSGDILYELN